MAPTVLEHGGAAKLARQRPDDLHAEALALIGIEAFRADPYPHFT